MSKLTRVQVKIHSCMEFNIDADLHPLSIESAGSAPLSIVTPYFKEWELIRNGSSARLTFQNGRTRTVRIVGVSGGEAGIRLSCEDSPIATSTSGARHG